MTLRNALRGFRAPTTLLICAGLALSPAVANSQAATKKASVKKAATKKAAANKRVAFKEVTKKPATTVAVTAPAANTTGLGNTLDISAKLQLAAMNTAIKATPSFFAGRDTGCKNVTPMLATQPGQIMAGNFRDSGGNCYVWLNMEQSSMLTGSEICKTTLHEMGHLTGLQHAADQADVMYSPFITDPIPAPCVAQSAPSSSKAATKAKTSSVAVCPPGATNADYCAVATSLKKKATPKKKRTLRRK